MSHTSTHQTQLNDSKRVHRSWQPPALSPSQALTDSPTLRGWGLTGANGCAKDMSELKQNLPEVQNCIDQIDYCIVLMVHSCTPVFMCAHCPTCVQSHNVVSRTVAHVIRCGSSFLLDLGIVIKDIDM